MARRRKNSLDASALFSTVAILVSVVMVIAAIAEHPLVMFCFVGLTVAAFAFFIIVLPRQRRNEMFGHVDSVTDAHLDALIRQQTILIRADAYGKPIIDKWQTEVKYFIVQHVRPAIPPTLCPLLDKDQLGVTQRIMQRVETASQNRPALALPRRSL